MNDRSDPRWTLPELLDRARAALQRDYQGPSNRQVQAMPSQRTLRYYTTLGLLDRPADMAGRTALYGWHHLLQVVAIKRLQEQGLSLLDVQQRLTGRADEALAAMARLPLEPDPGSLEQTPDGDRGGGALRSERRDDFWKLPAEATTQAGAGDATPSDSAQRTALHSVSAHPGLVLVWSGLAPGAADLAALRRAVLPLVDELKGRGLLLISDLNARERKE